MLSWPILYNTVIKSYQSSLHNLRGRETNIFTTIPLGIFASVYVMWACFVSIQRFTGTSYGGAYENLQVSKREKQAKASAT